MMYKCSPLHYFEIGAAPEFQFKKLIELKSTCSLLALLTASKSLACLG